MRTQAELNDLRKSMRPAQREKLLVETAEEFASLPVATLKALERRGLAAKRGQRWRLTNEGYLARLMEQADRGEDTLNED